MKLLTALLSIRKKRHKPASKTAGDVPFLFFTRKSFKVLLSIITLLITSLSFVSPALASTWSFVSGLPHGYSEAISTKGSGLLTIQRWSLRNIYHHPDAGIGNNLYQLTGIQNQEPIYGVQKLPKSVNNAYFINNNWSRTLITALSLANGSIVWQWSSSEVGYNRARALDVFGDNFLSYISVQDINTSIIFYKDQSYHRYSVPNEALEDIDIFNSDVNYQAVTSQSGGGKIIYTENHWTSAGVINTPGILPTRVVYAQASPMVIAVANGGVIEFYNKQGKISSVNIPGAVLDMKMIDGLIYYTTSQSEIGYIDNTLNKNVIGANLIDSGITFIPTSIDKINFNGNDRLIVGGRVSGSLSGALFVNDRYYAGSQFGKDVPEGGGLINLVLPKWIQDILKMLGDILNYLWDLIVAVFYVFPALVFSFILSVAAFIKMFMVVNMYMIEIVGSIFSSTANPVIALPDLKMLGETYNMTINMGQFGPIRTILNAYAGFYLVFYILRGMVGIGRSEN